MIPWREFEEVSKYSENFGKNGNPALSFRVAFGALLIQTKLKLTDEETVEQIKENPYMQYFIGYKKYSERAPFNASLMVAFRKRLNMDTMLELNNLIAMLKKKECEKAASVADKQDKSGQSDDPVNNNSGTLILDATCTPAAITYPTDLKVLGQARKSGEKLIDTLHKRISPIGQAKPRTYSKVARRKFLPAVKQRRIGGAKLRKALREQMNYLNRNLNSIDRLLSQEAGTVLKANEQARLETLRKVYEQEEEMYREKKHRVDNRIVRVSQPHVRPIVRGKAGASVEFGAKVSIAIDNGITYVERVSWDNFNEGITLRESVERYNDRNGH